MAAWLLVAAVAVTLISWRVIGVAGAIWQRQAHTNARCVLMNEAALSGTPSPQSYELRAQTAVQNGAARAEGGTGMSKGVYDDEHGEILDWLHEMGRQRAKEVLEFDVEKTISRAYAARDAGAVNFWDVLNASERSTFERAAHLQTFGPGTALMREKEEAHEVIVILDGWVKVCLEEDGQERVITERGPGDLVGERGTVPGGVRSATVLARDEVQALVMKTADYMAFVTEYPGVPDLVKKQTYDRSTGRADRP
jgi:hypothetical protein